MPLHTELLFILVNVTFKYDFMTFATVQRCLSGLCKTHFLCYKSLPEAFIAFTQGFLIF